MKQPRQFISHRKKKTLLEFYKAHYTPKEASEILELSYAVTSNYYRGFKISRTTQYNRLRLFPGDLQNDFEKYITKNTAKNSE